jgi:hypothetical protein
VRLALVLCYKWCHNYQTVAAHSASNLTPPDVSPSDRTNMLEVVGRNLNFESVDERSTDDTPLVNR